MARVYKTYKSPWVLLILLIAGGIVGNTVGKAIIPLVSFLKILSANAAVGFGPVTVNLDFLTVTLGFSLAFGPFTALGIILGYLVYRRL